MKNYENIMIEVLFFPAEDVIRTSDPDKDNTENMPDFA